MKATADDRQPGADFAVVRELRAALKLAAPAER